MEAQLKVQVDTAELDIAIEKSIKLSLLAKEAMDAHDKVVRKSLEGNNLRSLIFGLLVAHGPRLSEDELFKRTENIMAYFK